MNLRARCAELAHEFDMGDPVAVKEIEAALLTIATEMANDVAELVSAATVVADDFCNDFTDSGVDDSRVGHRNRLRAALEALRKLGEEKPDA